jgi:hypothetical protein
MGASLGIADLVIDFFGLAKHHKNEIKNKFTLTRKTKFSDWLRKTWFSYQRRKSSQIAF